MNRDSRRRSIAKATTWRITGSLDTILLSWLFIGDLTIAAAIGLTEIITKMVLYYFHERVWERLSLGRDERNPPQDEVSRTSMNENSPYRSDDIAPAGIKL